MSFLKKKYIFLGLVSCVILKQNIFCEDPASQTLLPEPPALVEKEPSSQGNAIAKSLTEEKDQKSLEITSSNPPKLETSSSEKNSPAESSKKDVSPAIASEQKPSTEATSVIKDALVIKQFENYPLPDPLELHRKNTFVETKVASSQATKTEITSDMYKEALVKTKRDFLHHWINGFKKNDFELSIYDNQESFNVIIKSAAEAMNEKDFIEIIKNIEKFDFLEELKKMPALATLLAPSFKFFLESLFNLMISFKHLTFYEAKNFPIYIKENFKINKNNEKFPYLVELWGCFIDICWINYSLKKENSDIDKTKKKFFEMVNHRPKMNSLEKNNLVSLINLEKKENLKKIMQETIRETDSLLEKIKIMDKDGWIDQNEEIIKLFYPNATDNEKELGSITKEDAKSMIIGKILDAKNEASLLALRSKKQVEDFFVEMSLLEKRFLSETPEEKPWKKRKVKHEIKPLFQL